MGGDCAASAALSIASKGRSAANPGSRRANRHSVRAAHRVALGLPAAAAAAAAVGDCPRLRPPLASIQNKHERYEWPLFIIF